MQKIQETEKLGVWELEMSDLPELGGDAGFLTAKDIKGKDGMTVTITEAPRIVPSTFLDSKGQTTQRARVTIKLSNGEIRAWTLNNTTYSALKGKFGNKAKSWVNKKVKVTVIKQLVRNEMKNVIYGEPA